MDNYVYPAAVLFVVGRWLAAGYIRQGAPDRFCRVFVVPMMINGGLAVLGLFARPERGRDRPVVLDTRPWFGYGAGGLAVPYGTAWAGAIVVGGLLGVAMLTAVVLLVASTWWRNRVRRELAERHFATCVTVL
ncbi:hypothetical protein [Frankia tisae]|uniref:hypothetical protein n=1 Tax=Frankia tisae TaxID=2950104 RepID=UPI0021C1F547|nr:hypothetical protein [Frankia tisae]